MKDFVIVTFIVIFLSLGTANLFGILGGLIERHDYKMGWNKEDGCREPQTNLVKYVIPGYKLGCWLGEEAK